MRSIGDPDLGRRSCSSAADSLTGISSGSATIAVPVCSWSVIRRVELLAPGNGSGPTRAIAAKVRGVCRKPIPWPVAGASTITRSYLRAGFDLAVELRQLPDLADRDQLLEARGGRREVVEDAGCGRACRACARTLSWQQHVLAHRLVGVDRDRPQVLRHLDLVEADFGVVEDPRGVLLRRRPRRRSCACLRPRRAGRARPRRSSCRRRPCR